MQTNRNNFVTNCSITQRFYVIESAKPGQRRKESFTSYINKGSWISSLASIETGGRSLLRKSVLIMVINGNKLQHCQSQRLLIKPTERQI